MVFKYDNKIVTQKLQIIKYLEQCGIKIKPLAPYT